MTAPVFDVGYLVVPCKRVPKSFNHATGHVLWKGVRQATGHAFGVLALAAVFSDCRWRKCRTMRSTFAHWSDGQDMPGASRSQYERAAIVYAESNPCSWLTFLRRSLARVKKNVSCLPIMLPSPKSCTRELSLVFESHHFGFYANTSSETNPGRRTIAELNLSDSPRARQTTASTSCREGKALGYRLGIDAALRE